MPIEDITPVEAKKILDDEPETIYLDVRSIPEFEQEHPEGAINIPILHKEASGSMAPNPDFLEVVQANIPEGKTLVVGCLRGGRSLNACHMLSEVGFEKLYNVKGGFGGALDPRTGQITQAGWKDSGLPTSQDCSEGVSYESLRAKSEL